ncbi:MAG: hypothetical protein HOQ24_05625 [Mycobacteriaceae bacterium]|nr:hypothetical protein [Mycobacteriaceae bacterium]
MQATERSARAKEAEAGILSLIEQGQLATRLLRAEFGGMLRTDVVSRAESALALLPSGHDVRRLARTAWGNVRRLSGDAVVQAREFAIHAGGHRVMRARSWVLLDQVDPAERMQLRETNSALGETLASNGIRRVLISSETPGESRAGFGVRSAPDDAFLVVSVALQRDDRVLALVEECYLWPLLEVGRLGVKV